MDWGLTNVSTAHNRTVSVRRLTAARATQNTSRASPFLVFCSATFFVRWNYFAIPLSRTKNVSYSQNVMRNVHNMYWKQKEYWQF